MFKKVIGIGLLALLFFSFWGAVGTMSRSRHEAAWMQGYLTGQQAAEGVEDGTAAVPSQRYVDGYSRFGKHQMGFPGIGLFLCLLPLGFFGLLFLAMGTRLCKHGRPPWRHHGHKPPWMQDDWSEEPIKKA